MTVLPLIRRFDANDGPGCWAVFLAAVRIGARDHYSPAELAEWLPDDTYPEGYADWLAGRVTIVAEQENGIVGFLMMQNHGYLDLLFVLPEQRRTGLAGRLYQALLPEAQVMGITRMTVKASRLAEKFFARQGWRQSLGSDGAELNDAMSRHMEVYL